MWNSRIIEKVKESQTFGGEEMNLSDMIENFILETIGDGDTLNLSRNELANFFNVSPSQINYVLSTRFTFDRGFETESKRGGGGYIVLRKLNLDDGYLSYLIKNLSMTHELDYSQTCYILENLEKKKIITNSEAEIIKSALSNKALSSPLKMENSLRYNIFKNILVNLKNRGN